MPSLWLSAAPCKSARRHRMLPSASHFSRCIPKEGCTEGLLSARNAVSQVLSPFALWRTGRGRGRGSGKIVGVELNLI